MKTFNYVITDEVGIHARPAGLLVKEAKNFTGRNARNGSKKICVWHYDQQSR